MNDAPLSGRRILVVEDEYFLVVDLERELRDAGAIVVGPVATVGHALELIERKARVDAAVLDIDLGGEMAYAVADALAARSIPFLFATGYGGADIPARYADISRCEKPAQPGKIVAEIARKLTLAS